MDALTVEIGDPRLRHAQVFRLERQAMNASRMVQGREVSKDEYDRALGGAFRPKSVASETVVGLTPLYRLRRGRPGSSRALLAPLQFLAFAVSLVLVLRYLATGRGYEAATVSILIKTAHSTPS
jgi:hypothetical protein